MVGWFGSKVDEFFLSGFFCLPLFPSLSQNKTKQKNLFSFSHLHPQADAQVRLLRRARVPGSQDLALDAAAAEASRDQYAVCLFQSLPRGGVAAVGRLAVAAGARAARGLPSRRPSVLRPRRRRLLLPLSLLPNARLQLLGLDPLQVEPPVRRQTGVLQGLDHRQIGVGEARVLADDGDRDRLRERVPAVRERGPPVGEVWLLLGREMEREKERSKEEKK